MDMNRNSCLLSPPDVVQRICSRCDRSTLLSLSTTSRAFSTPALQKLWRSLTSFAPIFLTLPEDAVKCTETSLTYRPFVPPVLLVSPLPGYSVYTELNLRHRK